MDSLTSTASKQNERKQIIPKLNLQAICSQTHPLSSREATAFICKAKVNENTYRYNSDRTHLLTGSKPAAHAPPTYEQYKAQEMQQSLSQQVSDLTLQLNEIQKQLSSKQLSFEQAGKMLYRLRKDNRDEHHGHAPEDDDDLALCLHLVETLWQCRNREGLSCAEFSSLLANMLNRDERELQVLFQKMDADGDETLSWNEYVSYLCQQQRHLWRRQETKNVAYFRETDSEVYAWDDMKHMVSKLCMVGGELSAKMSLHSSKYAMLTADNLVQIRNAKTLQLESSLDLSLRPNRRRSQQRNEAECESLSEHASMMKSAHVTQCTDVCHSLSNRLALSFMDRCVNVYAPTFTAPIDLQPIYLQSTLDRKRFKNEIHYVVEHSFYSLDIPQCLSVLDASHFLVGDIYGNLAMYNYLDQNCRIRRNKHSYASSASSSSSSSVSDTLCPMKQVKSVPRIGIVSCGMDRTIVVTDPNKWHTTRTLSGHTRGVHCIDFSLNHRILVSGGYDRRVIVWDPYVCKPLGFLSAQQHHDLVNVVINQQDNQIVIASVDKKIQVFDIRTWKCLQTMRDALTHSPVNALSCIAYDEQQSCLLSVGSKLRKWYIQNSGSNQDSNVVDSNGDGDVDVDSHIASSMAGIVCICYSSIFQQVISVHIDAMCVVWDVQSGQNSFEFKICDRDRDDTYKAHSPITTAAIDDIGKRLLVATQNGTVQLWNFNNGALMHQWSVCQFEVSKLLYLARTTHCVVLSGFSPCVMRLPSHQAHADAAFLLCNKHHCGDVGAALCATDEHIISGCNHGLLVECHIDSNVKTQTWQCPKPFVCITCLCITRTENENENERCWYLIVGTEHGVVHIFCKNEALGNQFVLQMSISQAEHTFSEAILSIAINRPRNHRLMVVDCDGAMKVFDVSNICSESVPRSDDIILMRAFKTSNHSCFTSLLYIAHFNVFCTASDNGQLLLWSVDGIMLAQFGRTMSWNLFASTIYSGLQRKTRKENGTGNQLAGNSNETDTNETNQLQTRKSYFDDHSIHRPKFINTIIAESIQRTLEHNEHKQKRKKDVNANARKTLLEEKLDKMVIDLVKPKKRKRKTFVSALPKMQKGSKQHI